MGCAGRDIIEYFFGVGYDIFYVHYVDFTDVLGILAMAPIVYLSVAIKHISAEM